MVQKAEVIIVGGGIVGCATAYLLARTGIKTTIVEQKTVGSCASGFAAGLLNPLSGHGIPGPVEPLARESFRIHALLADELRAETGVDPQLRTLSCVWLFLNEDEAAECMEIFQLAQRQEGFGAQWLDAQEVRALEPRVSSRVIRGMRVEGVKQVESYQYTLGLAQAAEKYGATILHDTVVGLRRSNGRISGVVLGGEVITCEVVVLAMGPWTGQTQSWLDMPVPVRPLKGQILRLELEGTPPEHTFFLSGGGYVSSKPDGLIWAGTTEEIVGFDDRPTTEARDSILRDVVEILPVLSRARLVLQTACLRPVSEDELPLIGEVPGWEGVYMATGAGRKGILLGPAMAQSVADLVTTGRTELPIGSFSPDRFAR